MADFIIPPRFGFLQHHSLWDNSIFEKSTKGVRKLRFSPNFVFFFAYFCNFFMIYTPK